MTQRTTSGARADAPEDDSAPTRGAAKRAERAGLLRARAFGEVRRLARFKAAAERLR